MPGRNGNRGAGSNRTTLRSAKSSAKPSADNPAAADNPVAQLAVRELAAWPSADWEPHSHVGWRAALESWYAAILTCIDDTLDAQRALICQTGMAEEAYASNAAMPRWDGLLVEWG